jgi:hypothetical protein
MEHDGSLVERPVGVESRGSELCPDTDEPWKLQKLQKLRRRSEKSRRRQGQRGPLPLPFPLLPPADAAHCGMCRGQAAAAIFTSHHTAVPCRGGVAVHPWRPLPLAAAAAS